MKNQKPSVDIIIIAYNEEKRILNCLISIASQSYGGEVTTYVVDDGSNDKTCELISAFSQTHRNVNLIRHKHNKGRGEARRTGIKNSSSSLLCFVDADIEIPRHWLDSCVDQLTNCDATGGIAWPDGDVAVLARITGAKPRIVAGSRTLTGNNFAIHRSVIEKYPFPKTGLGEDFRYFTQLKNHGLRLARVENLIVSHKEGKSYTQALKWLFDSGVDATHLLREFREVRIPDIASFVFALSLFAGFLSFGFSPFALLSPLAILIMMSTAHVGSRFFASSNFFGFAAALFLNVPLISAYVAGRLVGIVKKTKMDDVS